MIRWLSFLCWQTCKVEEESFNPCSLYQIRFQPVGQQLASLDQSINLRKSQEQTEICIAPVQQTRTSGTSPAHKQPPADIPPDIHFFKKNFHGSLTTFQYIKKKYSQLKITGSILIQPTYKKLFMRIIYFLFSISYME